VKVEEWSEELAREVESWHYEPPYDFYDLTSDPADAAEMRAPERREQYRAIVGADGRLDAFWYFKPGDDVVEIGLGLRPDLTGRGLGESFLTEQLAYVREQWGPERFRLYVAAWNQRAIRLYERIGFREVGREMRNFELVGQHEFVRMERPV
jgi:[ribosomal protein S18]-alanine N-acetyltransferase